MKYSEEQGYPFKLYNVTAEKFRTDRSVDFPGEFELEYDRDQADYVYESVKTGDSGRKEAARKEESY